MNKNTQRMQEMYDIMKRVFIRNNRGEKLAAYLFSTPGPSKCMLIICHGFRGAKENGGKVFAFAEKLNQLGVGVLAVDFAGSGESEGDFAKVTLSRQAEDLGSVITFLDERFSLPVILLGRSFGGSTVLAAGSIDDRIQGFIFWSTPVFLGKTFFAMMPNDYQKLKNGEIAQVQDEAGDFRLEPSLVLDFQVHDMDRYLDLIGNRPALIIQGQEDKTVASENALYMHEHLQQSELCLIPGADHRFVYKTSDREKITLEWIQEKFIYK